MKQTLKRLLSLVLVSVLITAIALCATSCDSKKNDPSPSAGDSQQQSSTFTLEVTFADGTVKTESYSYEGEAMLGDYLQQKGVISGDESAYGLYVKTVMGETLDYDTDNMYWSVYVNGEMSLVGISSIKLEDGAVYALRAEKGQ